MSRDTISLMSEVHQSYPALIGLAEVNDQRASHRSRFPLVVAYRLRGVPLAGGGGGGGVAGGGGGGAAGGIQVHLHSFHML